MSKKWSGADMRCEVCNKYLPDRCTCNGPSIEERQAAQPAPASTGRDYDCYNCGGKESAHHEGCPAVRLAARELDVEAERREPVTDPVKSIITGVREFYLGLLSRHLPPDAFDQARADDMTQVAYQGVADRFLDLVKSVAAQGSQPESAQVSTEQAGDAWISVEDRLPEEDTNVIILYWPYNNHENSQVAGQAHFYDECFWAENWNPHHPPSHWMPMPAAPSPNNSPMSQRSENGL